MGQRAILLLGLLGLLAGCPREPNEDPGINAPELPPPPAGAKITSRALPPGWPDWLPVYPGARVVEGRIHDNGQTDVRTAFLTTPDEQEQVIEFYGKEAGQRRFLVVSTSQVEGEMSSLYRRGAQSLAVSTRRDTEASLTLVEVNVAGTYEEGEPSSPRDAPGEANSRSRPKQQPPAPVPGHPLMPVYPGAAAEYPASDGRTIQRRMTTADTPGQVAAYYEDFYAGQGLAQESHVELEGQTTTSYRGQQGVVFLLLSQAPDSEGKPQTRITLTFEAASRF